LPKRWREIYRENDADMRANLIGMSLSAKEPLIIGLVCESTAPPTHIDTQMHLGLTCIQADTGMDPERECARTRVCTSERERVRARLCLRT